MARLSRRKVGKILKISSRSCVALRGSREHIGRVLDSPRSCPDRSESAPNASPAVTDEVAQRHVLAVEHAQQAIGAVGERGQARQRDGEIGAAPAQRRRLSLHPGLEGGPGLRIEGTEDLVELHRVGDLRRGQRAALGQRLCLVAAGRQLHIGLAEEGLLPQDRPRVVGDRRVLAVQLDRRLGVAGVG